MTDYYFTENPNVEHDEKHWRYTLLGHELNFVSDNGVFSKNTVDFGTRTLLEALPLDVPQSSILDVGCGYGPMGIALAKQNAEANGVTARTRVYHSDAYEAVAKTDFTTVVSNPPVRAGKTVVNAIITGAKEHLTKGGQLIIVLQKKQGAPSAKKLMAETFGNVTVLKKNKGYYILRSEHE
ncbi:methyltransferase [Pediococcus acidilactici]|uniref:class I SAM-dependent methyltransferase n=1 Tax=Pediococcus acidilactici TaxID=1254 RepID=UPI00132AAC34|nr:methyltransferase [Pediococcus acidilactici]KAF0370891.1 methyltransferase [Pediococcus acidilactici]KAF0389689.1 methyltransferase [Pediococcus acidilactici]